MAQVVDSKQKELDTNAIITIAIQETGVQLDVGTAYASIINEIKSKGTTAIREGNTIFIIHHAKDRIGTFRPLNADTARNYINNVSTFLTAAYNIGFDTLYTQFQDPTLLSLFKIIFKSKPPETKMGYSIKRTEGDGYSATIKLGEPRGSK